jgi:hypothetical protein
MRFLVRFWAGLTFGTKLAGILPMLSFQGSFRRTFWACAIALLPAVAGAKPQAKPKPKPAPTKPTPTPAASKTPATQTPAVTGALSENDRPAAAVPAAAAPGPRGPQRVDFDERVIEGQSNKSGSVYLYDRKDLQVDSMVKQPSTFRDEIAKGLLE